jgi:hypothetical protein
MCCVCSSYATKFRSANGHGCRSQWPSGIKRGSAAARLLGLRVRILPGGMDVCLLWELCVLSGRGLCDGPLTRPACGASQCNREALAMRPWPIRGCCAIGGGKKWRRMTSTHEWRALGCKRFGPRKNTFIVQRDQVKKRQQQQIFDSLKKNSD